MAFFLVGHDRHTGTVRLITTRAYSSRAEALDALKLAHAHDSSVGDVDAYVTDLDTASPVILLDAASESILPTPPATFAPPETVQPAATEDSTDEPLAPEVTPEEYEAEQDTLAAALKRAADSLESDGIVAPASIDAEPVAVVAEPVSVVEEEPAAEIEEEEPEPELVEEPPAEIEEPLEIVEEPATELDVEAEAELPDEAPAPEGEPLGETGWPWANVEKIEAPDEPADSVPAEEPELAIEVEGELEPEEFELEEPAAPVADDTMLVATPDISLESVRPVILGEYPAEAEPELAEVVDVSAEAPEVAPEEPFVAGVYEPAGELDLAEYTCLDCVYSNTCPKADQSSPAECGSFQWKSPQ